MKYFRLIFIGLLAASCNEFQLVTDEENTDKPSVMRPATATSKATATQVYEYRPAPGQFINEEGTEPIADAEQAARWALKRLTDGYAVSLGAFGGYITVGFDHSIVATGGYDFAIGSNAFKNAGGASNEPGVVWVMQDTNGNGLPDDTWYELRGSEWGKSKEVTITYFKPDEPSQPVRWEASDGTSGQVEYIAAMHKQEYYYPMWLGSTISFTGTRLPANFHRDETTRQWWSEPYEWGYVDNVGTDAVSIPDLRGLFTGFRIANAIDKQGQSVSLQFIDFVRVQTSVIGQMGGLGEQSTEVTGFYDLSI